MAKKKKISANQATINNWAAMIGNINSNKQSSINGSATQFPQLLPVAMKIAAKTIGMDFVTVKPLSAPSGNFIYVDYVYNSEAELLAEQKRKDRKQKIEEIFAEEIKIINEENNK